MQTKQTFYKVYYEQHHACPQCNTHPSMQTLAGYFFDPRHPESYRDQNDVICECGWRGTVHELKPRP